MSLASIGTAEERYDHGACEGCQSCETERPCVLCGALTANTCSHCGEPVCFEHEGGHYERVHEADEGAL